MEILMFLLFGVLTVWNALAWAGTVGYALRGEKAPGITAFAVVPSIAWIFFTIQIF